MAHSLKRLPSPATSKPSPPVQLYRAITLFLLAITLLFTLYYSTFHSVYYLSNPLHPFPHHLRRILRLYQRQLHLHPLLSRALTAGLIFFIADTLAQLLKRPRSPFSPPRLFRYSLYGFIVMGPFLYLWYALMNEYGPEDDLRGSLQKCLFEQFTLEPICISLYIIYDGLICRRGWHETRRALDRQFLPLFFKNAVFWLPANFANYYIGTPDLRVVFANLCSLFWNIYFSTKVNRIALPPSLAQRNPKFQPVFAYEKDGTIPDADAQDAQDVGGTVIRAGSRVAPKNPKLDPAAAPRRSSPTVVV
eukprot:GFKZ01007919.1.p1 GENE.GFKZ01007919.1~~GFKZ01007919.1.p1  ORF type:complete len:305 (-),score=28.30 GFKZ01007919.1:271-1185(-)